MSNSVQAGNSKDMVAGSFFSGLANNFKAAAAEGAQMAIAKRITDTVTALVRSQFKDNPGLTEHPLYQIAEPIVISAAIYAATQTPMLQNKLSPKAREMLNSVSQKMLAMQTFDLINTVTTPFIALIEDAIGQVNVLTEGVEG